MDKTVPFKDTDAFLVVIFLLPCRFRWESFQDIPLENHNSKKKK